MFGVFILKIFFFVKYEATLCCWWMILLHASLCKSISILFLWIRFSFLSTTASWKGKINIIFMTSPWCRSIMSMFILWENEYRFLFFNSNRSKGSIILMSSKGLFINDVTLSSHVEIPHDTITDVQYSLVSKLETCLKLNTIPLRFLGQKLGLTFLLCILLNKKKSSLNAEPVYSLLSLPFRFT